MLWNIHWVLEIVFVMIIETFIVDVLRLGQG